MSRWAVYLAAVAGVLLLTPAPARAQSFGEQVLRMFGEAILRTATNVLIEAVIPEKVAVAPPPSAEKPKPRAELSDWVDPNTGSTAHAGKACQQRYVAYLTGARNYNYLEVKLFNDSDDPVDIRAHSEVFGEEASARRGALPHRLGHDRTVMEHSGLQLAYELAKDRFYKLRRFSVGFEVVFPSGRACPLQVDFSRSLPAVQTTFARSPLYETGFSVGAHLTSGPVRDAAGAAGLSSAFFFSWYPALQHGIRFEFASDSLHGERVTGGLLLLPGYEFRTSFSPSVAYSFGIGAGGYVFIANEGGTLSTVNWALMVREQMQLKFQISTLFALCPAVTFGVLPGGPFGPHELSGAFYTGSLQLQFLLR